MYPEGTKTCKICGHILWRENEHIICDNCRDTWKIIAKAFLELLPNKACTRPETGAAKSDSESAPAVSGG